MLINDEWCNFFKAEKFQIGVSLDGPKFINDKYRVNRKGKGTFEETIKGINLLQKHGVEFSILSVLTSESLNFPDEIYSFFSDLNISSIAFNVEESEGINTSTTFKDNHLRTKYRNFMSRIYDLNLDNKMKIREIEQTINLIIFRTKCQNFYFQCQPPIFNRFC